jgi:predicted RNase H-like HicB family nuclease
MTALTEKIDNYTVMFEREPDGGYHVSCPALKKLS